jgi:hypothetical protein
MIGTAHMERAFFPSGNLAGTLAMRLLYVD